MFKYLTPLLAAGALLAPAAAQADDQQPNYRVAVNLDLQFQQNIDWQFDETFDDSCSANQIHVSGEGGEHTTAATQQPILTEMTYYPDGSVKFDGDQSELIGFATGPMTRTRDVKTEVIGNDEPDTCYSEGSRRNRCVGGGGNDVCVTRQSEQRLRRRPRQRLLQAR